MNAPKIPISLILADKSTAADEEPKKKTREDWRKAKELEEARKAGQVAAQVDEEGTYAISNTNNFKLTQNSIKQEGTSIHIFHSIYPRHRGIMAQRDRL